MASERESLVFEIPAGDFDSLQVGVRETEGFWIFEIQVEQQRAVLDDIGTYVLDHDNFLIWRARQQAARTATGIPPVPMVISGKLHRGTLSFRPAEVGQYYLVLDNSHSSLTSKVVHVLAYWFSWESPSRKAVRESLALFGWHDTWKLFEKIGQGLMNNHLAEACFNMRTAIATLWKQVAERNSGQTILFDPGKSVDIGALQKPMESYVPAYVLSAVRQSWSLASELAHVEKRGGQEPPLDQVMLALRQGYASAAFLVSLLRR